MEFFREAGTGAVVITNGPNNLNGFSTKDSIFTETQKLDMPVSEAISQELKKGHAGDTTGCGDNFVGGVIANMVYQIKNNKPALDLEEACAWGIVSGGYSCFYVGGTYFEKAAGEKLSLILPFYEKYLKQITS
jgi:sugar/nucleoside kinase (ribokinase family)